MLHLVKRDIFDEVASHLKDPEITIIIGPRQVGKTTLLFQLKEYLVGQKIQSDRIKNFNMDVFRDKRFFENQDTFIEYIKSEVRVGKLFLFIDEVQRLENPGLFFKGVYDLGLPVKLVLTGSSGLEIKSKIHEALTGRKRVFLLSPFTFHEYLAAGERELLPFLSLASLDDIHREQLTAAYQRFLIFGGYPKVIFAPDAREKYLVLNEIYQSYVEKDIVGFLNIADPDRFSKCILALAHQTGGLVNIHEISRMLGIARKTVERYLQVLEETFVLFPVKPFYTNPRTELKKMNKWYFRDTGLRNFIIGNLDIWNIRNDQGALLENAVAHELLKRSLAPRGIHFWRSKSKAEVDFVIPGVPPVPFEVKHQNSAALSHSFRSFIGTYNVKDGYWVGLGKEKIEDQNGWKLHRILPWRIPEYVETR